jgi:hypothetical protein
MWIGKVKRDDRWEPNTAVVTGGKRVKTKENKIHWYCCCEPSDDDGM